MGLERNGAALFLKLHSDGIKFGRVLTLGRQNVHMSLDEYARALRRAGQPPPALVPEYMDDLLLALGAARVEAMDFSTYEGASLVHDLNRPIPDAWRQQYDLVFDGGTLEHVFEFPTAIRNCMELLKPGGHFVAVTMPNNWCGHGFYQFSPELFFRVFSPTNGFSVVEMYLTKTGGRAFAVRDPEAVRSRVELCNDEPMFLLVHARRDEARPLFAQTPQQSDYVTVWADGQKPPSALPAAWKSYPVIRQLRTLRHRYQSWRRVRRCSLHNREFYQPVDLKI